MTPVRDDFTPAQMERMQQDAIRQMRQMHNRAQSSSGQQGNAPSRSNGEGLQSQEQTRTSGSPPAREGNFNTNRNNQQNNTNRNSTNRNNRQNNYNRYTNGVRFSPFPGAMPAGGGQRMRRPQNPASHPGGCREEAASRDPRSRAGGEEHTPHSAGSGGSRGGGTHPGNRRPPPGPAFDLGKLLGSLGLGGQPGQNRDRPPEGQPSGTGGLLDQLLGPEGINLFEKDSLMLLGLIYFLHREGADLKLLLALGYILL